MKKKIIILGILIISIWLSLSGYSEAGTITAHFTGKLSDYGLDTDDDDDEYYNYLVINVEINVSETGEFRIKGGLCDNLESDYISHAYTDISLSPGTYSVEVKFDGREIYNKGYDGPYKLYYIVLEQGNIHLDHILHAYTTGTYSYTQFQPPQASFTGSFTDYGLDTDNDEWYNYLVVNVEVNVIEAGDFRIRGNLYDNLGNNSITQVYTNISLLSGTHTVELKFDGREIYNKGYDGPYKLRNLDLYQGNTYLDDIQDAYTTGIYSHTQFQLPDASFTGSFTDYALDTDDDEYYNYLVINAEVNVIEAGDFRIRGNLYDNSGNHSITYVHTNISLLSGTHTVELKFDGREIYNKGYDGPYKLCNLDLYQGNTCLDDIQDAFTTGTYSYTQFQPPKVSFTGSFTDYGLDTDNDEWYNYLVVNVEVNVIEAGDFRIRGNLYDNSGNHSITYGFTNISLSPGTHTIELKFDGREIYDKSYDGPYKLQNLYIRDENTGTQLDYISNAYTTGTYSYTQFQIPEASFTGSFTDYCLDTDDDERYNYLVINVEINVLETGEFRIDGNLYDNLGNYISCGYTHNILLATGTHTIELKFDGREIYSKGYNGPYKLRYIKLWQDYIQLDYISNAYTTGTYSYTQFQSPNAKFTGSFTDYALDTDDDERYNYLVINAEVNVIKAGEFRIEKWLYDNSGSNSITYGFTNISLSPGTHTIELKFDGRRIYDKSYDGPYKLQNLYLRDENTGAQLDYISNAYTTGTYSYTQFQIPEASFTGSFTDYGLDTDNDEWYNYLVVKVEVNVIEAGDFRIRGNLYDNSGNHSITYVYTNISLLSGTHTVELKFDGREIYNRGYDGPYGLRLDLWQSNFHLEYISGYTGTYSYTQFQPPQASFTGSFTDYALDTDDDEYYNYLVINAEVNAIEAGDFRIRGNLYDNSGNHSITYVHTNISLLSGTHTVELKFDGREIYNKGYEGPYKLRNLDLYQGNTCLDDIQDAYTTGIYSHRQFQLPDASFTGSFTDYGLDTDNDEWYNYLVVNVEVNVIEAGDFRIRGKLYDNSGNNSITYVHTNISLLSGTHTVELKFDGREIYNKGYEGPYKLRNLDLYQGNTCLDDIQDAFTTGTYSYTQFQPPEASFTGSFTDYCLDTDDDERYNYLVINVEVNVIEAGDFRIRGNLYDNLGNNSITYVHTNISLLSGTHTVELKFDGREIYNKGYEGPYKLRNLDLYQGNTCLDDIQDAYTTGTYSHTQFQLPDASFTGSFTDYALDTDDDEFYNYLVVNHEINVVNAGEFRISGELWDNSGNSPITSGYTNISLQPGTYTIKFKFNGRKIYNTGYDGPYKVDNVRLCIETIEKEEVEEEVEEEAEEEKVPIPMGLVEIDTLPYPYITGTYSYTQFQIPEVTFSGTPTNDYGLDTDGDGLHNYLVININVKVRKPGEFMIKGLLCEDFKEPPFNVIKYIDIMHKFLSTGTQTIALKIDGKDIYSKGINGPYNLFPLFILIKDDSDWMEVDYSKFVYTTSGSYKYTDFQPLDVPMMQDLNKVCVYPNPFIPSKSKTDVIIFKNLTQDVTLRIFTISGELVFKKEGIDYTYEWDGRNDAGRKVASGVYLYCITNTKGDKCIGKLAIIK
ncbi:MAG: gliding motility-associated C-terminal domain-containing protein [bacterium]